jgi:hypothetical protein
MIYIGLNKELDKEVYKDFFNFSVAGRDFGALIRANHPEITLANHSAYIDNFYNQHTAELEKSAGALQQEIDKKQPDFLKAVEKIFQQDFSIISSRGYLSIFNCNPRYVETKSFQIYYQKEPEEKLGIVFHEFLHFVFFDYCDGNLKDETAHLDKNKDKFWELSEVFNVIILNLPEFRQILEREEKLFYPNLTERLKKCAELWNQNISIKEFIKKILLF